MNITILAITPSTAVGKNNKPYQVLDVAYKNNTFQGKVEGKKITSYSQPAFSTLAEAQPGTSFEIETEKKNGFIEWVKLTPSTAVTAPTPPQSSAKPATTAPRSTYETPEERAIKQVYIVRQSSINSAIAVLSVGAKSIKEDDVFALAKKMEAHVFRKEPLGGATGFEDFPDVPTEFAQPNVD